MQVNKWVVCLVSWTIVLWVNPSSGAHTIQISSIRLTGGRSAYEGRVEIQVNGIWGTICHTCSDINAATVLCKMMGKTTVYSYKDTGAGTGPVFINHLWCSGTEQHIHDCNEISNYKHYCTVAIWIDCEGYTSISSVRLVGEHPALLGRVEIHVNGEWGSICNDGFGDTEATVLCKMMGLSSVGFKYKSTVITERTQMMQNVECEGDESNILDCDYKIYTMYYSGWCSSTESPFTEVAVVCSPCGLLSDNQWKKFISQVDDSTYRVQCLDEYNNEVIVTHQCSNGVWKELDGTCGPNKDVYFQLINGASTNERDGEVEACVTSAGNNYCRSVCGQSYGTGVTYQFGGSELYTINSVLGCSGYSYQFLSYVRKTGQTFIDKLKCRHSDNFEDCTFEVTTECSDDSIVHLSCSDAIYPDVMDVRLIGGDASSAGRVEVNINGTWGGVADYAFGQEEADVVCRMLNLKYMSAIYFGNGQFDSGEGPILMYALDCTGSESTINDCDNYYGGRYYWNMVEIICSDAVDPDVLDVQLIGGDATSAGRVEVNINGIWGGVADNNFGQEEADVVCQMLNLKSAIYYGTGQFDSGEGPILVHRLYCTGSESTINDCNIYHGGSYNYMVELICSECDSVPSTGHGSDFLDPVNNNNSVLTHWCSDGYTDYKISYYCTNGNWSYPHGTCDAYDIQDIRLVDGLDKVSGRVEVLVGIGWGTICGSVNTYGLKRLCYMAGFGYNNSCNGASSDSTHGTGNGPILIENLVCADSAITSIDDCSYSKVTTCTDSQIVSIQCEGDIAISSVRMTGGTTELNGYPEVKIDNIWQRLRLNTFDRLSTAAVVCRQLGKSVAISHTSNTDTTGVYRRVSCSGTETTVNDCNVGIYWKESYQTTVTCTDYDNPTRVDGYYKSNTTGVYSNGVAYYYTVCEAYNDFDDTNIITDRQSLSSTHFCDVFDCGPPTLLHYWDAGFFKFDGSAFSANCAFYNTYIGTLTMYCHTNGTWIIEGECQVPVTVEEDVDLPLILGLTFGCASAVAFAIAVVILYRRRRTKETVHCLTAPLDATTWDLLLVVDAKDMFMMLTERLKDALESLNPKVLIKRTNIHRLYIETSTVRCKKAIFFVCKGYTSPQDCARKLIEKIQFKNSVEDSCLVISSDSDFIRFETFHVAHGPGMTFTVGPPNVCSNDTDWMVPFVRMYFKCKRKTLGYCEVQMNHHVEQTALVYRQSILDILREFGVKQSVERKEEDFKLGVANNVSDIAAVIDSIGTSNTKRFYLFVNEMGVVPDRYTRMDKHVRIFNKIEIIKGVLHILTESGAINAKLPLRKNVANANASATFATSVV